MRTIGVVSTSRSDYGIYKPLLEAIRKDAELELRVLVSGMHLSSQYGTTVRAIEQDGFDIAERIEMLLSSDTPQGISKSIGVGVIGFADSFSRWRPDILVVLGDRFEMHAAALAALPFKIPVAHLSGGELTEGAIDDALRHSLTKLSHLHFPATEEYGRRIAQMGEEPWRVTVAGEPSLDQLRTIQFLSREELERRFSLRLDRPFVLSTFHPVTLEYEQAEWQIGQLLAALESTGTRAVFTMPNADTGNHIIRDKIQQFVAAHEDSRVIESFGSHAYFSMMKLASAIVGNSSSGIVEAASFALPAVNIGTRQDGRVRARNVIDVGYGKHEIARGIAKAVSRAFRDSLDGLVNPYGSGQASRIITERLRSVELGDRLIRKKFYSPPIALEDDRKPLSHKGQTDG
ncbi:MAG: UDP-N-acetylglucosamine 2-epimerase (hydrolyzing) [Acidobacteriaceae bacterium]|nr:UDP-N-acetylglucosamine 2-epimerase (hydrolyzing) [Acidobacteriaceae bacterium]